MFSLNQTKKIPYELHVLPRIAPVGVVEFLGKRIFNPAHVGAGINLFNSVIRIFGYSFTFCIERWCPNLDICKQIFIH